MKSDDLLWLAINAYHEAHGEILRHFCRQLNGEGLCDEVFYKK